MDDPLITLTTDFGTASPYVAAMKGVILSVNPRARLLDLTHDIPPQNIDHTAFFLASALPYFPAGCIHVVVVDPGVGTDRALLYVELGNLRLLVPDNGCWTELERTSRLQPAVIRLTEPAFWRASVSATFHGRDVLAPVAGHLSLGVNPNRLGAPVDQWIRRESRPSRLETGRLVGEVVFVDHFGNLLTNLSAEALHTLPGPVRFTVGDRTVDQQVRTYAEAQAGTAVALISSSGHLEIAVSHGNAAQHLQAHVGTPVIVTTWNRD